MGPFNRVQRVGAQAIVGTFLTVVTSIAEAEASIPTARKRIWRGTIKLAQVSQGALVNCPFLPLVSLFH